MKVVCINNHLNKNLIIGETYEVIDIHSTIYSKYYNIKTKGGGLTRWINSINFKKLEEVRDDKLTNLLSD